LEPLERTSQEVEEAWEELEQLCNEFPVDSGGERLSRDQPHERR
jgi:hypothetical protein